MTDLEKGLNALGNSVVNKDLYEQEEVNVDLLERFPSSFAVDNKNRVTGSFHNQGEFVTTCDAAVPTTAY